MRSLFAAVGCVFIFATSGHPAPAQTPPSRPTFPTLPSPLPSFALNVGDRICFAPGRDDVDAAAMRTLERQATWMLDWRPSSTYRLEGHAEATEVDAIGLRARRAERMKAALMGLGVAGSRLIIVEPASAGADRCAVAKPGGCDGRGQDGKPHEC